jgi:hypothetical protein
VVTLGVWHDRDLRDSSDQGRETEDLLNRGPTVPPQFMFQALYSVGLVTPPPPQRDIQMLWVIQEQSSALVYTQ